MIAWLKAYLFSSPDYFKLDQNREYSNEDLINILKEEDLSIGQGNAIVLCLLDRVNKKLNEIESGKI